VAGVLRERGLAPPAALLDPQLDAPSPIGQATPVPPMPQ
jgi:hypothetical protein